MSKMMDKEKLQALAQELAKDLKTPADLSNFCVITSMEIAQ